MTSVAYGSLGCAPKKESHVARDMKIVKQENDPALLLEKGKAFHAVGDLVRAEQYYAAAMQQGAPEREVLPLLLRVCIDSSRYQVAIDYATPALSKHPDDWRLRLVVASLYSAIGQPEVARVHYERALETHPDEPTAHYALGVLFRDELKDPVSADQHFREYLRLAPDGPHADEAKGSLLKPVAKAEPAPSATVPTKLPSVPEPGVAPSKLEGPKPLTGPKPVAKP